jgi:hypothetical protein
METPVFSNPTQGLFLKVVNAGTSTYLEGGDPAFYHPYTVQCTGTLGQTFYLPDTSLGNSILFTNLSGGVLTLKTRAGVLITTLGSSTSLTLTSNGAGWSYLGGGVVSQLPVSAGGTGQSGLVTTPTSNAIVAMDASGYLAANNFLESCIIQNGDWGQPANAEVGVVLCTLVVPPSTGYTYTLAHESDCRIGLNVTFINQSLGNMYIKLGGHTDIQGHTIPPNMAVRYIMTNPGGDKQAWLGCSTFTNQFDLNQQMSFAQPYTYGSTIMNCPYTGTTAHISVPRSYNRTVGDIAYFGSQPQPFNFHMDRFSPATTVINSWYQGCYFSTTFTGPVVFLPDVTTIPVGSVYEIFFNNGWHDTSNAYTVQYEIWGYNSSFTESGPYNNNYTPVGNSYKKLAFYATGGQPNNCKLVCMSNDPALGEACWNITSFTQPTDPISVFLKVLEGISEVVGILSGIGPAISGAELAVGLLANGFKAAVEALASISLRLPEFGSLAFTGSRCAIANDSLYPMRVAQKLAGVLTEIGELSPAGRAWVDAIAYEFEPPFSVSANVLNTV